MNAPGGITIVVYGEPAPQGSKRFVGVRAGRGVMVESSKKVKPWRQDVAAAALTSRAIYHLVGAIAGPVRVKMVFTVRKPLSAPKRRRTYPSAKPDLSKLARATEDALTTAGIWEDDARVVEYSRLAKVFPGEDPDALDSPGVLIDISAVV
jgi:Holliday junction resolvase RusA-like endonuclease